MSIGRDKLRSTIKKNGTPHLCAVFVPSRRILWDWKGNSWGAGGIVWFVGFFRLVFRDHQWVARSVSTRFFRVLHRLGKQKWQLEL